jgi:hypothetical protein
MQKNVTYLYTPAPQDTRKKTQLEEGQIWVEKADPAARWVIVDIVFDPDDGKDRVYLNDMEGRPAHRSYSEAYFRRHFSEKIEFLRKRNEKTPKTSTVREVAKMVRLRK